MRNDVGGGGDAPAGGEADNLVMDLDSTALLVSRERCLIHAPLTAVSAQAGTASLGLMVSLLDIAASEPALAASRPDWIATQDLSVHATGWLMDGPMVIDAQRVRVGKKSVTMAANVY